MGWGEAQPRVEIDAHLTLLQDLVVLRKHGDIGHQPFTLAVDTLVPALLHAFSVLPDGGQQLPAWIAREVQLLIHDRRAS